MEKIGKYQILEKLGEGGMGVVYKALDTLIERVVAVKMVSSNLDADPELRARFFREGRAAGQLSHKNIVTIFDLGEDKGTAYIAMEFLEGEDLRARIVKGAPMDLPMKIQIMAEVCEGLAHAHQRNVIHRDIKPANIFLTKTGQVKILDFGLARTLTSDLTTSGHALGTPNYMSPEQVRGEKVDYRTDIFSVGVLTYELLTHHKAFQGDSFASTIFKILQDDPEPIDHFDPAVSPELCEIVYKALAKDREQRYTTLGEMQRDLERFCGVTRADLSSEVTLPDASPSALLDFKANLKVVSARAGAGPVSPWPITPRPAGSRLTMKPQVSVPPGRPSSIPDLPEQTLSGADGVPTEATTEVEAFARPGVSSRPRRLLTAVFVAVVTLGIALVVSVQYRAGKEAQLKKDVVAAAPSSAPVLEKTLPLPAPSVKEPPSSPPPDQETADGLARALQALNSHRYSEAAREAESVLKRSPGNAEAQSVLQKARDGQDSIRTGIRKAKSYFTAGDYPRAKAALGEVLSVAPSDQEAQQLAGQLNQVARRNADQALGQLKDARSKAEDAHASELATQSFNAAKAGEAEAGTLYAAGRFEEAAVKSGEAVQAYRRAENEARAESSARAERSSKAEAERQQALLRGRSDTARAGYEHERDLAAQAGANDKARDQFGEAEKIANLARSRYESGDFAGAAHDYDASAAAMRQARSLALEAVRKESALPPEPPKPAASVASIGKPAAESPETVEAIQKAIYTVPERFKAAMESKDLALLKSIWPTLGSQQEQAFRSQWAYTRSLRLVLQNSKIEKLAGDSAIVAVQLHNEQAISDGTNRKWNQKAVFNLSRKGRTWFIESVSFEAIR